MAAIGQALTISAGHDRPLSGNEIANAPLDKVQ